MTRVAVIGTGAVGCVFAARLTNVAEVWVLGAWEEAVATIRERGVRVHEADGRICDYPLSGASTSPSQAPPCDVALLLVKSYQTDRAASWAGEVLAQDGLAVTLQNGLDNAGKLAAAVGSDRAAQGVGYVGATNLGPGETRFIVSLTSFIGAKPANRGRCEQTADLLTAAGLRTEVVEDIEARIWQKAIINAAINPLTALWRVPNGDLLHTRERRDLVAHLAREAHAVALARGVQPSFDDPVGAVAAICEASKTNHSSMLQDIERGRPTEIESINGVIVAEGERLGVPTPYNRVVLELVRALPGQEAAWRS
jgi:2-dehydropantoate 2-reductase